MRNAKCVMRNVLIADCELRILDCFSEVNTNA